MWGLFAAKARFSLEKLAYEPLCLAYLRDGLGIKGVKQVSLHEPLTNLRKVVILQLQRGMPRTEVWRALYGMVTLHAFVGKFVIAVDEDIDPHNADAVLWAMSYRCNPAEDTHVIPHREPGHGPRTTEKPGTDSALLIDATMKGAMPPLALHKREYMENAKALWEKLGLPPLKPEMPWFGYSLGDWRVEISQCSEPHPDRPSPIRYAVTLARVSACNLVN